ncbi:MAG: transcriptional regulator [Pseudonocardiales bacterium]|nr:MAG: transcriptional regulator [Pseudonocardiales bacterium]
MHRDSTARALSLLSLLQSGVERSGPGLASRLQISERTLRRDMTRLRQLGYTIDARPGPGSTYQLRPGLAMPPLLFEDEEITAVVAGLRWVQAQLADDAATRALTKLGQVLPERLRRRAAATDLATEVLDGSGRGVTAHTVGAVADAVAADGRIRFAYRDQHGRVSSRLIDPYRHVLNGGRWYLVGYDIDRDDWRTFRFDRVTGVERVHGSYRRRPFPDDSIGRWLGADFGRGP